MEFKYNSGNKVNIDIPHIPHKEGVIVGVSSYLPLCVVYIVLLDEEYYTTEGNFVHKAICVPEGYLSKGERK